MKIEINFFRDYNGYNFSHHFFYLSSYLLKKGYIMVFLLHGKILMCGKEKRSSTYSIGGSDEKERENYLFLSKVL